MDKKDSDLKIDPKKARMLASVYIKRYFSGKNVAESVFSNPKYVELCVNTDTCSGMDIAYKAMGNCTRFKNCDDDHPIEKDVRFVVKLLREMSKIVPKEFSAGILLMHLELIEGIQIS